MKVDYEWQHTPVTAFVACELGEHAHTVMARVIVRYAARVECESMCGTWVRMRQVAVWYGMPQVKVSVWRNE